MKQRHQPIYPTKIWMLYTMLLFFSLDGISRSATKIQSIHEINDSTDNARINGRILIANAGFAPVPAFSFNSPIVIGFLTLKKKRFSYEPDFALGLNGKPWMANNWFRLNFLDRKSTKLSAGVNPSLFFLSERVASGEEILNALRNLTFEFSSVHKLSTNWSFSLTYMLIHAFDKGALSGNFFDASSSFSVVRIAKKVYINLMPQLFYFNFTGNVDGFFTSASIRIEHQKIPLSIYFQGVLPIWTDFSGASFKWNTGIVYAF